MFKKTLKIIYEEKEKKKIENKKEIEKKIEFK